MENKSEKFMSPSKTNIKYKIIISRYSDTNLNKKLKKKKYGSCLRIINRIWLKY